MSEKRDKTDNLYDEHVAQVRRENLPITRGQLYKAVLIISGRQNQIDKALEEMGELQQAIARWRPFAREAADSGEEYFASTLNAERHHVIEEIADVMIMLEQLAIIFGRDEVFDMTEHKLRRLARRYHMPDMGSFAPVYDE